MQKEDRQTYNGLPYINNWQGVLLTLAVNLLVALLLFRSNAIPPKAFVLDACHCGFIATLISVALAAPRIKRLRQAGGLPREVEAGKALRVLPRRPLPLAPVLGLVFAVGMAAFAFLVCRFFEVETITSTRFLVWKLVYATLLSVKTMDVVVLRLVQPDCAAPGEPEQTGSAVVRNPLPHKQTFGNLFHTVTEDFGFNLLMGLATGGVVIRDHNVIIQATSRDGIVIGGLVLGILVTFRMVYPVAKSIRALRDAGQLPKLPRIAWIAWLPERPALLALALLLPTMALSAAVLWGALSFFGFEALNFFQYFVVRTLYVTLLSKLVVKLAILRYTQPTAAGRAAEA